MTKKQFGKPPFSFWVFTLLGFVMCLSMDSNAQTILLERMSKDWGGRLHVESSVEVKSIRLSVGPSYIDVVDPWRLSTVEPFLGEEGKNEDGSNRRNNDGHNSPWVLFTLATPLPLDKRFTSYVDLDGTFPVEDVSVVITYVDNSFSHHALAQTFDGDKEVWRNLAPTEPDKQPAMVEDKAEYDDQALVQWEPPTRKEDGSPLLESEIREYELQEKRESKPFNTIATVPRGTYAYLRVIDNVDREITMTYRARTIANYTCLINEERIHPCPSQWSEEVSKVLKEKSPVFPRPGRPLNITLP